MPNDTAGLTHTRTRPLNAVSVDADQPPSHLWDDLSTTPEFQQELVGSVQTLLTGIPYHDAVETLFDAGVTAADGGLARLLADLGLVGRSNLHWRALRVITQIGQGTVTPLGRLSFDALSDGPVAALQAADSSLTVAVHLDQGFRNRRRDQREQLLELLATLATAVDVRLVCSSFLARWLATEHRAELPAEFSECCKAGLQANTETDALVTAAIDEFGVDSRHVAMLRQLADNSGETLSYRALQTAHDDVSPSRVSQVLGDLEKSGLVERWGPRHDQYVDLLPAGGRVVEYFDTTAGRQQTIETELSDTGQAGHSDVWSQPPKRPPSSPPDQTAYATSEPAPYSTSYLDHSSHHGAAGTATAGTITVAPSHIPECEDASDRHTRYVSYLEDRDEAVVAVRATTPLQYMTSIALALASPRLLDKALPAGRLEAVEEPPAILRDARCIGGLSSSAVEDGEQLRENIHNWAENLREMTADLEAGRYENRARFCGEILRTAHGLAGSLVHLLDCAGVELVRELRLPATLDTKQHSALARTVSIATSIQSRYGAFATYRQLFETREDKRNSALSPVVDAADPFGEYIGSLVVRGPAADRFEPALIHALESPQALHEDAPEIAIHISVERADRTDFATVSTRLCKRKNVRPSREAVDLLRSLAQSPYAVADALRWLGSENQPRQLRLAEIRVALSYLEPDRLLTDAPPTVEKAVAALLSASKPLSQSALANRAGISVRSLRRHSEVLQALELVRETDSGDWRLAVPFRRSGRTTDVLPTSTTAEATAKPAQEAAFEAVITLVDGGDTARLVRPDTALGAPFCGPPVNLPADIARLIELRPAWQPWLRLAQQLAGAETQRGKTVQFGAEPAQHPLPPDQHERRVS